MAKRTYSYVNKAATPIGIDTYRFLGNGSLSFASSIAILDAHVGTLLDRYVDGVVDNNLDNDSDLVLRDNGNVNLATLLAGEDPINNWIGTVNGATAYQDFKALTCNSTLGVDTNTFGVANGFLGQLIGTVGSAGNYLHSLLCSVKTATNSRVLLQDLLATTLTSTGAATWASGTPTAFTFAHSSASAATANTLVGQYLVATYTVNGTSTLIARRINAVPTTNANTSYVLTIDSPAVCDGAGTAVVPTAAVTTSGTHFILPLHEVLPAGVAAGSYSIPVGCKSKYGGWRIFVDSGVSVRAIGRFS